MKVFKLKLIKIFIATIFSFALLFPIVIKSIHTWDGHEHQVCNDFTSHIHKKQLDCSICDFHFSIFDFTPQQLPEFLVQFGYFKTQTIFRQSETIADASLFFLRGPPLLS